MPRRLVRLFHSEDIKAQTIGQRGWKGKPDGTLLDEAQHEFDVFVTTDQGIPHQQNIGQFDIGIILIEARSNRFADLAPLMNKINSSARKVAPGQLITVNS